MVTRQTYVLTTEKEHDLATGGTQMNVGSNSKMFCSFTATASLLLVAWFILASMLQLPAQNVVLTGGLSGRITDQTGAVVPGASVIVRNLATAVEQSGVTNRAGLYRFPVLMPGAYSITADLKGFRDVQ